MLDAHTLILPLIILFIIVIALVIFIIYYTKNLTHNLTKSINNDYNNYKIELKNQNDTFVKQLLKQISDQNNLFINAKNGEASKNLVNIFIKLRESIRENCVTSMNKIKAARIAIYLFHNGSHSTHGISFLKISCVCEKVAIGSGIRERMMEHTNIPINLFDDMIDKLMTFNRYIIMNNEDLQESSHKMFISADKIKYAQLIALYDINNNMLGFISVEMDKPYSKDEVDNEKEILDELAKQLVPVLSYCDYTSIQTQ